MATAVQRTGDDKKIEWGSPQQEWLFSSGPQPTLLMGGYNSGKTYGACLKVMHLAFSYPHSHIAIVRKTYKQLTKTTMKTFYALLDPGHYSKGTRNDSDGYLRLNNGTEIFFIHLDAPNSLTLLSGLELNAAFVDQAEEISNGAWDILETRVGRWTFAEVPEGMIRQHQSATGQDWPWRTKGDGRAVPPPYLFATANPPGDELHWLYERFCEQSEQWQTKWRERGYQYRSVDTREHRFALQQNVDVLLAHDDAWVDRFVSGHWGRPEGCIFRVDPMSELDYDPMLIARIRNTMRFGRALDHGDTNPTCCIIGAADADNNLFIFLEYYQAGIDGRGNEYNVSNHRKSITDMSRKLDFEFSVADPQIFWKSRNISGYSTRRQRWSIASEYLDEQLMPRETAIFWTMADNNEDLSRTRLREYLRVDPNHKHPITGERGAPHLYFVKQSEEYPQGCDRVIAELKAARRIQVGEVNGRPIFSDERDRNIADHALDGLRYYVGAHPLPVPPPLPQKSMSAEVVDQGRVILTMPDVRSLPLPREFRHRRWRGKGGGY